MLYKWEQIRDEKPYQVSVFNYGLSLLVTLMEGMGSGLAGVSYLKLINHLNFANGLLSTKIDVLEQL